MKEQKKLIKEMKNSVGITLIALVITIIVLLILAGVSISMLTGDNSILSQAGNAKELSSTSEIVEKLNLSVIGALSTSTGTTIEEIKLKAELDSYFGEDGYIISGDEGSGWTVTVDGHSYLITNTGDVEEIDVVAPDDTTEDTSITFDSSYASIDVIWLDTNNNVISSPNAPVLSDDMTKVTWTYDESARNMDRR